MPRKAGPGEIRLDSQDYLKPWHFSSNDQRLNLDIQPCLDRNSSLNRGLMKPIQHQVFGYFSGSVTLDDGRQLQLENFLGCAEDAPNRW